jgi:hypothetical protein
VEEAHDTLPAPSSPNVAASDSEAPTESTRRPRSVPRLCIGSGFQTLEPREREVLALVDGVTDLDTIVTSSELPPDEARETMTRLISAGVVELRTADGE